MEYSYDDLYFFFLSNRSHRDQGTVPVDLEDGYEGYCYFNENEMGVFIPSEEAIDFRESFANVVVETGELFVGDSMLKGYRLVCHDADDELNIGPFTVLCTSFLDPANGRREDIVSDPFQWCESWKNTLGNKDYERNAYPVIAEMLLMEELLEKGYDVAWTGPKRGVTDVTTTSPTVLRFEVKSTTVRGSDCVRMSEEFQIGSTDYLCVYKFEPVVAGGTSIEEMVDRLTHLGMSDKTIRDGLMRVGLRNTSDLNRGYSLLGHKHYRVDENFPDIMKGFIDGKKPERVNNISYTLDLSGLPEAQIPSADPTTVE